MSKRFIVQQVVTYDDGEVEVRYMRHGEHDRGTFRGLPVREGYWSPVSDRYQATPLAHHAAFTVVNALAHGAAVSYVNALTDNERCLTQDTVYYSVVPRVMVI